MKRLNKTTSIVHTALIISTVINGGVPISPFASSVGLPVGTALSGTSLVFSLAIIITQKSFKILTVKLEKHDAVKLLAQSKLNSTVDIVSQTI